MRREPCICGGQIVVSSRATDDQVVFAVGRHNMSLMHRIWRFGREGSTARYVIRDLSGCQPGASGSPVRFS